jgi:DNA-binding protein HU-beta
MANKADLVAKIQEIAGIESKAATEKALNAVLEAIKEGLKSDGSVQIIGFGSFEIKERAARTGVNPASGEKIKIAASKAIGFKAGKALKDEFNKPKAAKGAKAAPAAKKAPAKAAPAPAKKAPAKKK